MWTLLLNKMLSNKIGTVQQEVPSKHVTIHDYLEGLDFTDTSKSYLADKFMETNTSQYVQVGEKKAVFIIVFVANNIYRDKAVETNRETQGKSSDF